ncbi:nicotinate-nicotinamide nucleotide adenylyltransferase [Salinivibrio kushneri]|uniref:nicotinate-nicotinamide nucleotide adenylyltransferase n=1 Tax=Salinivibrio kushneri TaxID=1908198 RepID=UPI0022B3598B|nr:nicotinate-nicotinamide nucleotide adenylyltransferase [Salinivibrio kushneri]WBA13046.1 nicotinate-nicotinamide nucleotide adenylyltransferase [Salinivibrio kushneri]
MAEQIAVFGSAFNPPTRGHVSVLTQLCHFDRVLLVPSYKHAWGKTMAPYEVRCGWVQALINDLRLPNLHLCQREASLGREGDAVTTHMLLSALQHDYPNAALTFVVGPDNLLKFDQFADSAQILSRWSVLGMPEKVVVRSTHIRERLAQGLPVGDLTTPTIAAQLSEAVFCR